MSQTAVTQIALLGIPLDANSSHLFGAAAGPAAIRATLHSGSGNHTTEHGVDAVGAIDALEEPQVNYEQCLTLFVVAADRRSQILKSCGS